MKIIYILAKNAATGVALFDSNMHQIVCRLGLRRRPHWGAYSTPQTPYLYLGGQLLSITKALTHAAFLRA